MVLAYFNLKEVRQEDRSLHALIRAAMEVKTLDTCIIPIQDYLH